MPNTSPLISMPQIAKLARVQRPVVTMWRTRGARAALPFPPPVATEDGQELFDANQVGSWLAETGHGKNPDAEDDAAGFARLPRPTESASEIFALVTALLTLRATVGRALASLTVEELLEAADEHDPDDRMILREIERAASDLEEVARYVDQIVEGAYSEVGAFERLMSQRFTLRQSHLTASALASSATELISQVVTALALSRGTGSRVVDITGSSTDVLIRIGEDEKLQAEISFALSQDDTEVARLSRRRLRVHGLDYESVDVQPDGSFETSGALVHLAQFPPASRPSIEPLAMLEAIDQIAVQMDAQQLAFVLGPSAVLSDGDLDGEAEGARAQLLRDGVVRAIVRLPTGLRPSMPNQAQSIWLLGPAEGGVEAADRVTFVANLNAVPLDAAVVARLVDDLLASTGARSTLNGHFFRLGQLAYTRTLVASKGSLVTVAPAESRLGPRDPAAQTLRVEGLRARLMQDPGISPIELPQVETGRAGSAKPSISVRQLIDNKSMWYVPGTRLQPGDVAEAASIDEGVHVIGPLEVSGERPVGERVIDSHVFSYYGSGRVTVPGDVVFCTSPRPTAIVDRVGDAVVEYPARVLRIDASDPDGLLSESICADINVKHARDTDWRGWRLRRIPQAQRALLSGALSALSAQRSQAQARAALLEEFAALLIEVAAEGSVVLTSAP